MSREEEDFHRRWREGADSLARLYVSLLDAPYTQYEREFLVLQRRLLSTCETPWEQLETRRRVAEELLMGAYSRGAPWADFGRALAAPRDVPLYESMRQSLELIRREPGFERTSRSR